MKVGLYALVSTQDQQTLKLQLGDRPKREELLRVGEIRKLFEKGI
jgi:hypothetical protein